MFQSKWKEYESRLETQVKEVEARSTSSSSQTRLLVDEIMKLRSDVDELKFNSTRGNQITTSGNEAIENMKHDKMNREIETLKFTHENLKGAIENLQRSIQAMGEKVEKLVGRHSEDRSDSEIEKIEARLKGLRQSWAKRSPALEANPANPASINTFEFNQRPGGAGLGLQLDGADGETLVIKAIHGKGTVGEWLSSSSRSSEISTGDRIVQVNDVYGSASKMLAEIQQRKTWKLTIQKDVHQTYV